MHIDKWKLIIPKSSRKYQIENLSLHLLRQWPPQSFNLNSNEVCLEPY